MEVGNIARNAELLPSWRKQMQLQTKTYRQLAGFKLYYYESDNQRREVTEQLRVHIYIEFSI